MNSPADIINWDACLICNRKGQTENLSSFTEISWQSFKNAAEKRNDDVHNRLESYFIKGPKGYYHRKCYQGYTNKSNIRTLPKRDSSSQGNSNSEEYPPVKKPTTRARLTPTAMTKCIICQSKKTRKASGGIRGRVEEKLTQCQTFSVGETLLRSAKKKNDERIITQLHDQDVVASEVRYHKSCFVQYTSRKKGTPGTSSSSCNAEFHDAVFKQILREIGVKVIENHEILSLTDLHKQYLEQLQQEGLNTDLYRRQKLKKKIETHLGDKIDFWASPLKNEPTIIYSKTIPKGQLAGKSYQQHETDTSNSDTEEEEPAIYSSGENKKEQNVKVFQAAKILRRVILDIEDTMPMPPQPNDLKMNEFEIPILLYNMLLWLLTDSCEFSESKITAVPAKHNIINSIGQDLLYNASNGTIKTAKHLSLPITVKQLTGSSQVVEILNKLGHGVSLSTLDHVDPLMAEEQLQKKTMIPKNMKPNVFTIFCWDNNDILEETLSGEGTTHCTNGISIQRSVDFCSPDVARYYVFQLFIVYNFSSGLMNAAYAVALRFNPLYTLLQRFLVENFYLKYTPAVTCQHSVIYSTEPSSINSYSISSLLKWDRLTD